MFTVQGIIMGLRTATMSIGFIVNPLLSEYIIIYITNLVYNCSYWGRGHYEKLLYVLGATNDDIIISSLESSICSYIDL